MIKYLTGTILFLIIGLTQVLAQEGDVLDSLIDDLLFDDEELFELINEQKTYHFIYLSSEFSNKAFFAGREVGSDQHNVSGQISYFNSMGIFAGISGVWYSQLDPQYSTTVASIGYSKTLKKFKNLNLRASYSRYIYNLGPEDFDPDFKSNVRVGATLKKGNFGSRLDFTFLFGNTKSTNINWSIYSKIKLHEFSRFNKVELVPQFSVFFGEEDVEFEQAIGRRLTQTGTEEKFGAMNGQFYLPLRASFKNFDIEFGYSYNLPRSLDPEYTYDNASSFNVSVGYMLDF